MNFDTIVVVDGKEKYKGNRIVRLLLEDGKYDLNSIWSMYNIGIFDRDEMMELYKLIGYTINGFNGVFEFYVK